MSFGALSFSEDSFSSGSLTIDLTLTSVSATLSLGSILLEGNANVSIPSQVLNSSIGTVTPRGNANIVLSGLSTTLALGTVSIEGLANVSLSGLSLTLSIGDTNVVGNAVITITGNAMQLASSPVLVTFIPQDSYNKNRTVFVSYRQSGIRSTNTIATQNRTVIVPPRNHVVKTTKIAA